MTISPLAAATLLVLCSLSSGCDDAKKDAKAEAKAEAKAPEAKAEAKAPEAKAPEAKAPEAKAEAKAPEALADPGDAELPKIGVPECDDYVTKMTACMAAGTVPASEAAAQKMGLEMSAKGWADAMQTDPKDGPTLVPGCKAATDMAKLKYPTCFPDA